MSCDRVQSSGALSQNVLTSEGGQSAHRHTCTRADVSLLRTATNLSGVQKSSRVPRTNSIGSFKSHSGSSLSWSCGAVGWYEHLNVPTLRCLDSALPCPALCCAALSCTDLFSCVLAVYVSLLLSTTFSYLQWPKHASGVQCPRQTQNESKLTGLSGGWRGYEKKMQPTTCTS